MDAVGVPSVVDGPLAPGPCSLASPKSRIFARPRGDEDILWLDVAVDDALCVSGLQRIGYLDGETEQFVDLEGFGRDGVLEGLPLHQLHGNERLAIDFINIVIGADVGMIQGRCRLGFALKAPQGLMILGQRRWQNFQGHEPPQ